MSELGVFLGSGREGACFAGPERSTLVLGPSRSGKTSSLVIPNILACKGAVVSTSTKSDVLHVTASHRSTLGHAFLFDPSGTVQTPKNVAKIGWSPINAATSWDGALGIANGMVHAARRDANTRASENHWIERSSALLAPLMHAAAQENIGVETLLRWVDRHDGSEALSILADRSIQIPANSLSGILSTDQREQSSIWSTASGVLSAYRFENTLSSTTGPFLDADSFVRSSSSLYICAPSASQELFAPLIVGMLQEIRDATYRAHGEDELSHSVLFALDEVANMAPLPDLPQIVSEGAGQGLITMACLQDLSQGRKRWGRQADSFFSLFGTSLILPGIADIGTLETLSRLAGDGEMVSRNVSRSMEKKRGHHSVSFSISKRPRLPIDVIAQGRKGYGLVLDSENKAFWVELTPAHSHPFWLNMTQSYRDRTTSLSEISRSR